MLPENRFMWNYGPLALILTETWKLRDQNKK